MSVQLSGSTLTLDYANNLYPSSSTNVKVMAGSGHSVSGITTTNGTTLTELISILATGTATWQVTGSSSGLLGTITSCGASTTCTAFSTTKVSFTLTTGSTVNVGDLIDFVTIAASGDSNVQKNLQIGSGASSFRNGRSKLTIDAAGGFHAVGQSVTANPSLVTMLGASGTYYTFVDSGAFTVQYASMTNMDESGVQLSGTGPFSISNSTFDYVANGPTSVSTLLTLRSVTNSVATLQDVTYGNSRANITNYNYTLSGTNTGLLWTNRVFSGSLTGHTNESNDPNNQILWTPTTNPGAFFQLME